MLKLLNGPVDVYRKVLCFKVCFPEKNGGAFSLGPVAPRLLYLPYETTKGRRQSQLDGLLSKHLRACHKTQDWKSDIYYDLNSYICYL